MDDSLLTIGVGVVGVAAGVVGWRAGTLFLGLTWLAFFQVASTTLAGFAFSKFLNAPLDWFTTAHAEVVGYSILGCLAMLVGMAAGWRVWRPRRQTAQERLPSWIGVRYGALFFLIGVGATVALVFLWTVPTVGTGVQLLTSFRELALLVLLIDAMERRSWGLVLACLGLYVPISIAGALASGHTPAKVDLLIPAACVIAGWRQVGLRTFAVLAVIGVLYYLLFAGWMGSRGKIREGALAEMPFTEAASEFLGDLAENSKTASLDPYVVSGRLMERIDMTDILAAQTVYQPAIQPFVYGATFVEAGVALIPRVFWANKPIIAGGSAFVERFTGIQRPADDTTSVGLPYPFEFYANGGVPGVVIGLLIVGFVCARLEVRFLQKEMSLSGRLGAASVLLTVSSGGQRMDLIIPSLVAGALSAWALGWALEHIMPQWADSFPTDRAEPQKTKAHPARAVG